MGKSSPSPPPPPDPRATAEANIEANTFTQLTPFGNVRFGTVDPSGVFSPANRFTNAVRIEETPFQEQLRGEQEALALGLTGQFDFNLPPSATGDPSARAQQVSDQLFETNLERLTPEFDRQRSQLEQRLADQGIPVGSKAFEQEVNRFEERRADALNRLALQSTLAGSQESSRLFAEQEALRNNRLREIASILGQQTLAGANVTPQVPFTDIAGLTANQAAIQQQQFATQQAGRNARGQLLGSVAGTVLGGPIGGGIGGALGSLF